MAWNFSRCFQALGIEGGEAFTQFLGVVVADAEHDARAGMRHDGAGDFGIALQLVQFVMRQRQAEPIFPRSLQNLRHARRDEVVEFVHV